MSLEYIVNELSIALLPDVARAKEVMEVLVDTLRASSDIGLPNIRSEKKLTEIELSPGYFISSWCTDQRISIDKRLYILTLATKSPLLEGISADVTDETMSLVVKFEGVEARGLTLAYLTDSPVISLSTHKKWDIHELSVTVESLKQNVESGAVEVVETGGTIANFSNRSSLTANREKILKLIRNRISSIEQFWSQKEALFSQLEFAPTVLDNLKTIGAHNPIFQQAISKLSKMNRYCEAWVGGPCMIVDHIPNVSGESTSTMREFGEDRKFRHSSGTYYECELHARLTPGKYRLHFFPMSQVRKIFIGYIGEKLRSSSVRT